MSPIFCTNNSVGTLTSIGEATAPVGFSTLTKNMDNSLNLKIFSSDPLTIGKNYTFTLAFTDASAASVTQPTRASFNIFVTCFEDCTGPEENYILHGVLMWLSWGVFTIIQIGSKRWFSFSYKIAYWAHVVGGSIISICTLGALIAVLKKLNWKLDLINLHRVTGFTFLIMALIVVGFGLTAQFMRYTDIEWNTNLVLFISKFHKFGAWTIIGIGNIVCYIGISAYVGEAATTFVLIFFASAIFLVPVLYFEISLLLPD